MIQLRSRIKIVDNTGAKIISCFKVLHGKSQDKAKIGDIIMASVKDARPHEQIKKKEIVKAVIVRQKSPHIRKNGTIIKFDDNAAVIVDNEGNPKGTKIIGPIAREVKLAGFAKIASLSQEML